MVVQEHPAWAIMTPEMQPADRVLTDYLNSIERLDPDIFDDNERLVIRAQCIGLKREMISVRTPLTVDEVELAYWGVHEKMGVEQDTAVVYRACASGLVEQPGQEWNHHQLSEGMTLTLKAIAGDYPDNEIAVFLPGGGPMSVKNQKHRLTERMQSRNAFHAVACGFRFGMFAPDVEIDG